MSENKIENITKCPECNTDNIYLKDIGQVSFYHGGTGYTVAIFYCNHCKNTFELHFKFNYQITEFYN